MRKCMLMDLGRTCYILIYLHLQVSPVTPTSIKQFLTLYTSPLSWNDARQYCLEQGSLLVEVESSTKQAQLREWVDWNTVSKIWIGLHKIDPYDTTRTEWSDCTGTVYNGFSPGQPSTTIDDKHCFYVDSTGLYTSQRCDTLSPFVCQRDIGLCDFDENYPRTGCGLTATKAELDLTTCLNTCRDAPINSDGEECWAVGFWPDYSAEDCWMFHTVDPRACVQQGNFFNLNQITRYLKNCYDTSTNSIALTSKNTAIIPASECRLQTTTSAADSAATTTTIATIAAEPTTATLPPLSGTNTVSDDSAATTTTIATTAAEPATATLPPLSGTNTVSDDSSMTTTRTISTPVAATSFTTATTQQTTSSTSIDQSTAPTSYSNTACPCSCNATASLLNSDELKKWQQNIKKILTVNKRNTTLYRRSLISVYDSRVSAVAMGSTGVIVLSIAAVILFLLDAKTLCRHCKIIYRKLKKY